MSGQLVMQGFIHRQIPIFARRAITMIPALIVIGIGFNPTKALVLSQVFLSFGIPFRAGPAAVLHQQPQADGIAGEPAADDPGLAR